MNVWKYGDNINTDMLFPGKYTYSCSTVEEIKSHLLEDLDPHFAREVKAGDIILAGRNFGCGSSREQPVTGLKGVSIEAVVAESFARIFYRAAINQGLILINCPEAVKAYLPGMTIFIDYTASRIIINDIPHRFIKLPAPILAIRQVGGLLPYTRMMLKKEKGV